MAGRRRAKIPITLSRWSLTGKREAGHVVQHRGHAGGNDDVGQEEAAAGVKVREQAHGVHALAEPEVVARCEGDGATAGDFGFKHRDLRQVHVDKADTRADGSLSGQREGLGNRRPRKKQSRIPYVKYQHAASLTCKNPVSLPLASCRNSMWSLSEPRRAADAHYTGTGCLKLFGVSVRRLELLWERQRAALAHSLLLKPLKISSETLMLIDAFAVPPRDCTYTCAGQCARAAVKDGLSVTELQIVYR